MAGLESKVVQFYKDNGYRFSDFFDAKRHGGCRLNEAQIKAGGVKYYDKVMSGEIAPRQIEVGWGIIECAKSARFDDFLKDNEVLRKYKPIIQGLKDNTIKIEKSKRILWIVFWPLLLGFIYFLLEYIGNMGGIPV